MSFFLDRGVGACASLVRVYRLSQSPDAPSARIVPDTIGAQVQWGLEHLTLTAASLKALGAEGLFPPITLSCRDHEGGGSVRFQQWDGKQWNPITDWIAPDQALVRPLVEASAAKYAQDKGITPRDCP